jgi:AcrR family transcriptional regulator
MTSAPLPILPKKIPRQARSKATVEVILEATARILVHGGLGALTTNAVADSAGVSIGSLYQYFPSKEALVMALIRRMREKLCEDLEAAQAQATGKPLPEIIEAMVRASAEHHVAAPRLVEVLEFAELELPVTDEILALKARASRAVLAELKRAQVVTPNIAAFEVSAMCKGVISAHAQEGCVDFEPVIQRLTLAVCGYLGVSLAPSNS